jgi:hypothetical protein
VVVRPAVGEGKGMGRDHAVPAAMELGGRPWLRRLCSGAEIGKERAKGASKARGKARAALCFSKITSEGAGHAAAQPSHGGGAASAWKPRPDARRPLRPSTEHVVGDVEVILG